MHLSPYIYILYNYVHDYIGIYRPMFFHAPCTILSTESSFGKKLLSNLIYRK